MEMSRHICGPACSKKCSVCPGMSVTDALDAARQLSEAMNNDGMGAKRPSIAVLAARLMDEIKTYAELVEVREKLRTELAAVVTEASIAFQHMQKTRAELTQAIDDVTPKAVER